MKNTLTILILLLQFVAVGQGETEIRTDGIVFPSLTSTERDAITPVHGQVIFNETTQSLEVFDMSGWQTLGGESGIHSFIADADEDSAVEVFENGLFDQISIVTEGKERATFIGNSAGHSRMETHDRGDNVVMGEGSGLLLNSFQGQNVLIGVGAGSSTSTGFNNVFHGYQAGQQNEEGNSNVAIGHEALLNNVTADNNIAIGRNALKTIDINQESTTFGSDNVAIGTDALWLADRFTSKTTAIGTGAGAVGGTLANSVFIGHLAGTIIDADYHLNDALFIANDQGVPLVYGEFNNKFISLDGKLAVGTNQPSFKTVIKETANALTGNNIDISNLALVLEKGSNTANEGIGLGFQSSSSSTTIGGAILFERSGSASKGHMHFATKSNSVTNGDIPIRMTIEDVGNVGIGVTDPDAKLDINGDIIIRPSVSSGGCSTSADKGRLWFNAADGVLNLCTDALTPGNPGWVNLNFGL